MCWSSINCRRRRRRTKELAPMPRLWLRNHGQFRGIPGSQTAGHLDQIGDPVLVQDAGCDGGPVSPRAMYGNAAIARNFSDALLQMIERNVDAAVDAFRHPLARIS